MVEILMDTLNLFPRGLVYVGLAVVILALARLVQDLITPFHIGEQLTHKDNAALALSIAGYYLGVVIIFVGALYDPFAVVTDTGLGFTEAYWREVGLVAAYSVAGIVVLNIARILVDKLVLYQFSTIDEIVEQHNTGAGAVEFGVYFATSLIIAGSISGAGGGPLTSLAFAGLGLVVTMLFVLFYELTTSFSIHDEIENDNTAVGVALGGNLMAVGIVVLKAVSGDFSDWATSLISFAVFSIIGFILLLIVRLLVDRVLFMGVKVSDELVIDRNLGVAFIEATVVISISLVLFFAV